MGSWWPRRRASSAAVISACSTGVNSPPAGIGVQKFGAAGEVLDDIAVWPAGRQRRLQPLVGGRERG